MGQSSLVAFRIIVAEGMIFNFPDAILMGWGRYSKKYCEQKPPAGRQGAKP
jgi:hypothetical protein